MLAFASLGKMPKTANFSAIPRRQYFFTANGFRPRKAPFPHSALGQRKATFEAGENKTGHISAGANEGIFFFDSMNPCPN
jgi:hypothetical protein